MQIAKETGRKYKTVTRKFKSEKDKLEHVLPPLRTWKKKGQ